MKNSANPFIRSISAASLIFNARPLILAFSIAASVSPLWAVNDLYWDSDDTTPGGSSGDTAPGTWGVDIFWNPNQFGGGFGPLTALTGSLNDVHFSADTDVTGTYTVAVDAAQAANSITFQEGSVTLSGGTSITLGDGFAANPGLFFGTGTGVNFVGTPLILAADSTFANDSGAGTQTINGGVTGAFNLTLQNNNGGIFALSTNPIDNAGTITNNGTGLTETLIGAAIGSNVTQVIQNSPNSLLNLGGANSFGSLFIKAGTVRGAGVSTTPTFFGAGTITLGDTAPSIEPATLRAGGALQTYPNPIVLGSGTTGALLIVNNNNVNAVTFTGGITGTNNVTFTSSSDINGLASLNFTTNPVDNSGTLTNENLLTAGPVSISSGIGSNVTGVIQNSVGSAFVVSGTNTYNSPTNINFGNFTLSGGGSLAGTAVTAAAGATFQVSGDSTLGTTGSPSVTIVGGPSGTGGVFSLRGGVVNTVTINSATPGATVLTMGGGVGDPSQLNLEFGATADKIELGSGLQASIGAGGVEVNLTGLAGLNGTTQTLISAPGGGLNTGGGFVLNTSGNFGGATFTLNNTGTLLTATGSLFPSQPVLYFSGAVGVNWNDFANGNDNDSNWTTDAAGANDANVDPDATTDVHFYAANAISGNLSTVLGQNYTIKTLTMDGGALVDGVGIASGGGTLTLTPPNPATGITSNSGAGSLTISAPVILGGSQTWTNNSSNALTASGGVSGTANFTLLANSTGAITLSNSVTNIAGTITNSGSGSGVATLPGIGANVTALNQTSSTSPFTIANTSGFAINAGGTIITSTGSAAFSNASIVSGTGDLSLNANSTGSISFSGAVNSIGSITNTGSGIGISTVSGAIGTNNTGIIQNSATSQLTLSGTNTFTGGVLIRAGTLVGVTSVSPFGAASGVLTIGDSAVNLPATLRSNLASTSPVGNPIVLTSGVTAALTIASPNTGSQNTFTGGVTGNNNLILSSTGTVNGGMRFTNANAVNNAGTVTSSGTGLATTTIDLLGPNVISVIQAGTSPFTINSAYALTLANKTLVSTGAGLFTFAGEISGNHDLTLSPTGTGGFQLSGPASNTYTGSTFLSVGSLTLNKDSNIIAIPGNLSITGGSLRFTAGKNENIANGATVTMSGGVFNGTAIAAGFAAQNETFANLVMTGGSFNTGGVGSTLALTGTASLSGTANLCVVSGSIASFGTLNLTDLSVQTNNNTPVSSFFINGNNNTIQTTLSIGAGGLALNNSGINLRKGTTVSPPTLGSRVVLNGDVTTTGTVASFIRQDTNTTFTQGTVSLELGSVGVVTRTFTVGGGGADLTVSVPVTFGTATTADLVKQGPGILTLNQVNTYNGATTVGAGTLLVSGTGSINASSGVTISGATARFLMGSSVALSPTVTLTQGVLEGTGTINTVNVDAAGAASTKVIAAGTAGTGTLNIGTLNFADTGAVNVAFAGTVPTSLLAPTTLNASGAPGSILVNTTNSSIYTAGNYNLIDYGTFATGSIAQFAVGTIGGLSGRQSAALVDTGSVIQLQISGSVGTLTWTGAQSTAWTTTPVGGLQNWSGGTPNEFLTGDNVIFDNTAPGVSPLAVDIPDADVTPSSTVFSNSSSKNYTLGSTGGFAISTGNVTKSNTGSLTLTTANVVDGALRIDQGTVAATANQTLPSLNFGSANTITTFGVLDLSSAIATVNGPLVVQTNNAGIGSANNNHLIVGAAQALTVRGNVNIGTPTSRAALVFTSLYASGGGSLVVENTVTPPTLFQVGGNNGNGMNGQGIQALADFSGLSSLTISLNPASGTVRVNPSASGATGNTFSTLILPSTGGGNSTITANTLAVGDGGNTTNSSPGNTLSLGTGLTTLNINTINVGTGARDFGNLIFGGLSGTLKIRNATTAAAGGAPYESSRAVLNVGTTGGTTAILPAGSNVFDVRGHASDVRFAAVNLGTQNRGNALPVVFGFDNGTLDISSLTASVRSAPPSTGTTNTTTTNIFLGGGNVTIGGAISLASISGSAPATSGAVANLNISGGTVSLPGAAGVAINAAANSVASTTSTALVNITGGVTTLGGDILKVAPGAGTATATLTLDGTGTLDMGGNEIGGAAAANNLDVLNFRSGTLQNVAQINNGAGLTKTTAGTLILQGTNTYTGPTTINQGTLLANSATSVGASSPVSVVGGALGGTGTVLSAVTVGAAGAIAPGVTIGALAVASADLTAGGTLVIDLNDAATPKVDTLNTAGVLNVTNGKLTFSVTGTPTQPSYTIATAASVTGTFPLANITGLPSGYTLVYSATDIRLVAGGPTGFAAYMANPAFGLAIGDQDPNDDPEFDGIQNLAEYVLNGNPSVSDTGILPAILDASGLNLVITFTRRDDSEIDVAQVLQYGNDLSGWTDVVIPAASGVVSGVTFTINETPPTAGTDFVTASIPKDGDTLLFGRLKFTK